jgi:hypothetical protein
MLVWVTSRWWRLAEPVQLVGAGVPNRDYGRGRQLSRAHGEGTAVSPLSPGDRGYPGLSPSRKSVLDKHCGTVNSERLAA